MQPGVLEGRMNPVRRRILAVVFGVGLMAAVAFSQTAVHPAGFGHRGGGFGMLGMMGDYLDLTDAQRTQMKAILAKEKPTIRPLMQQLAQGHQQMHQLEQAGPFDETKVRTLATQQSQTMTELMVQKARIKSELMQVLTADQKTKLAAFEAKRQARFQRHFGRAPADPSEAPANP
jgi:Spy/CpxP family protein refolding chaperone